MSDKKYPVSQIPIRKTSELLPKIFQTDSNEKFLAGTLDAFVQPGVLEKSVGYIGRRYGKTYRGKDTYLDDDNTLRSRYQLEPAVVIRENNNTESYYDFLDFKNQLRFFGNDVERDDLITAQENYSWDPPIDWDKFVNYREYYWEPNGPPVLTVTGQSPLIKSTYTVNQGSGFSWNIRPDGVSANPTLILYRGQTYNFIIDSPGEGFVIRTNYDTGSLNFKPNTLYYPGQLAIYDGNIYKAKVLIEPSDGSSISIDSQDWELIDTVANDSALDYNSGVTNNGIKNGTLTFQVPYDAPDILFYQSEINPDRLGKFIIADIDSVTFLDVEKDILGKKNYTSSNGIEFTNGLVIKFEGQIVPERYTEGEYIIEGVGSAISLKNFNDLVPPVLTLDVPEIFFDNEGFDTQPYDDASNFPSQKDYITINRSSLDLNGWSRYNRWFHKSVLEYAYSKREQNFPAAESARAKRPIVEFLPNIKLFHHGKIAKQTVDYIDDYTKDVFSEIEGSLGYNIDGEDIFEGARILVTNDTDILANNKIYVVRFIVHNGKRQITLQETEDSISVKDDCVLIKRGNINAGKMFFFDGEKWKASQEKIRVNQPPLFELYDENETSFADTEVYTDSTFFGTPIVSYKVGNGPTDTELNFSLSYLNIDNIGDIVFRWELDKGSFSYRTNQVSQNKTFKTGYYLIANEFKNGWILTDNTNIQPIIDSIKISETTNVIELFTVEWNQLTSSDKINFYLNGEKINYSYTRNENTFTFDNFFQKNDIISVKVVCNLVPINGYYEFPTGLEKNPLNDDLQDFTLGQALNHLQTGLEFNEEIKGKTPGSTNLRDLDSYRNNCLRFMKHSGIVATSISLLVDKKINLIKAIQQAKIDYTRFKNNFLKKAVEIENVSSIVDAVDDILLELTKSKNKLSPYIDSDMIGTGAFSSIDYVVDDSEIRIFALSNKFSLDELSRKAVYVYHNGRQLINGRDYEFNSTFGFVNLKIQLVENDVIQIREYVSTSFSHIPPTPTKLGLYKKYTPEKYLDDTYRVPQDVIRGHDGSLTVAYGDFRDDLLLELEYRIYNNIKVEYDESIFNIDNQLGNYYYKDNFSKEEVDNIIISEFLQYVANTDVDYTENNFFDSQDSFTYTYSNMTDPTATINLPGYWRGVYLWFYDTDKPHLFPWEMLGFSQQPDWWELEYGPPPYTKGNLILWDDLANGIIRQGNRAGKYERYSRPTLLSHIPVDDDGNLISPLESGLATNFVLVNNRGSFKIGDVGPVEYSWRSSSEYAFAITVALCLLKPFSYITSFLDRSVYYRNKLNQIVNKNSNSFLRLEDIQIPVVGETLTSGLLNYLTSYARFQGLSQEYLSKQIKNIDVNLSSRLSGFVDKKQQKYLLDSKSPSSSSSSIFIPDENYEIIFNVGAPILNLTYSGIIIKRTESGWSINGYDARQPYFNYYQTISTQKDPEITVGGLTESFIIWNPNQNFENGIICQYRGDYYRCIRTHTSADLFDSSLWTRLPKLPVVGGISILKRRNFNKFEVKKLSYGTEIRNIQQIADFLFGYEEYLKSLGFIIDDYDFENQISKDFTLSVKEFMFWTRHNWAPGSLITLSPMADKIRITVPVGVVDSVLDNFYDYNILQASGTPLEPRFIDVKRSFQEFEIKTTNTTFGIYFLKVSFVLKENVVIFSDRTVFNDVIFEKTSGYRQERIKSRGFRTVDWDGDYTSPGFLFDNVRIDSWQPFIDYRLGDIVSYQSNNWVSKNNHQSEEFFSYNEWTKLDTTPEKQLIPNFDYRINQFSDYFEAASEGVGDVQRELARHTIGYQPREYLENLAEDSVTQYQIYQGFIRDKGTSQAITKVFNKLNFSTQNSVSLFEEWAFRIGQLGGSNQLREIEFRIDKNKLKINPQAITLTDIVSNTNSDQLYRITKSDFTLTDTPFTLSINPTTLEEFPVKDAGYVRPDQVEWIVKTRDDILNLDINLFRENDHIWVTYDKTSWNVLKFNVKYNIIITDIIRDGNEIKLITNRPTNILIDDIIGIRNVLNLIGFHKVKNVGTETINDRRENILVIDYSEDLEDPDGFESDVVNLCLFDTMRVSNFHNLDPQKAALLTEGSKLFVDKNENDLWEVLEKTKQYTFTKISDYVTTTPISAGSAVLYDSNNRNIVVTILKSNLVVVYVKSRNSLAVKQTILPPLDFETAVQNTFGEHLALSPDSKWLAISSPRASGVRSHFRGIFNPSSDYDPEDIVLFKGRLWECLERQEADGSTIDINSNQWRPVNLLEANNTGTVSGLSNQGMVSLYEFENNQWNYKTSIISPRPDDGELFGSSVAIGVDGDTYYMSISAPDSIETTGRVYLYVNTDGQWKHNENFGYKGSYDPTGNTTYFENEIVYYDGYLWKCVDESTKGDGSTINLESSGWMRLDPIATEMSLPQSIGISDDGSTLTTGYLDPLQVAELLKIGDRFGHDMAMSRDGKILAISAPYSDDQYFPNYRGLWRPDREYFEGDTVKFQNAYHQLIDRKLQSAADFSEGFTYNITVLGTTDWNSVAGTEGIVYNVGDSIVSVGNGFAGTGFAYEETDSTIRSFNEPPDAGWPWNSVGDSTNRPTGKIFLYKRTDTGYYKLEQTISADNVLNDDSSNISIETGDELGFSISLDWAASTLVVSSPLADFNLKNQGSVFIFRNDNTEVLEYRLKQKLTSFEEYPNEFFGNSVAISEYTSKIIVGANNSPYTLPVRFDSSTTTYDNGFTKFSDFQGRSGAAYLFELKGDRYFLTEKFEADLSPNESFGYSVDIKENIILIGSPDYIEPSFVNSMITFDGPKIGTVRLFEKSTNQSSWNSLALQEPQVNIEFVKSIALYDDTINEKISDLDFIDHRKLKILNYADKEIKFKTPYDPAIYSLGNDEVVVDESIAWSSKNVGQLWWDISNAKWINYEQGDIAFREGNWNRLAQGSSIDVYEWVESKLLPSEWSLLADTNEGLAEGISGQPLYPNDDVYSVKIIFNRDTELPTETLYYYWVKNSVVVPTGLQGRSVSSRDVSNAISNPISTNLPFLVFLSENSWLLYNARPLFKTDDILLNIQFIKNRQNLNAVHNEYVLLTEGISQVIPKKLEDKFLDSLVGYDKIGNRIPDTNLPDKLKYGVSYRPRQSMFVDRFEVLKILLNKVNNILLEAPFATLISFRNLNLVDTAPIKALNLYDVEVDNEIDLQTVGTIRVKQARLTANIVNGEISTVSIVDPGYGYVPLEEQVDGSLTLVKGPPIEIEGVGINAVLTSYIDNQGRIVNVIVENSGKNYSNDTILKVRQFSVLVKNDSTLNNFWSIYAWDDVRKSFYRSASQAFDTTKYWSYIDWYSSEFSATSRITREFLTVYEEEYVRIEIDDLIRIKEYGSGGWAIFRKDNETGQTFLDRFTLIGRENGTIQISSNFYDIQQSGVGFDNRDSFDIGNYDLENTKELRNIFSALKEDIFVGDYAIQWNNLFFTAIRHVFDEQMYVDWAFKTSFLDAIHSVGNLEEKINYKNDNLESYQEYVDEVKPYRTTVREYISKYQKSTTNNTASTDFDLPPYYSSEAGKIIPVDTETNIVNNYPWKYWKDNLGFELVEISIYDQGSGYITAPKVLIEGDGFGADAKAYIAEGKVVAIQVIRAGSGYMSAPTVTLVGGNSPGSAIAKATAILGNSKIRSFDVALKFDRITKSGLQQSFNFEETIIPSGASASFELKYPPTTDKNKIRVTNNNQLVLNNEYDISLFTRRINGQTTLGGRIVFLTIPKSTDIIQITYEKNNFVLDSVNRIEKYYNPTEGMIGKEINQLMTGVDFGGVQIQGTTFDVTGGWDALPWFTDSWDGVQSSSDYYVRCDGSTNLITLPYIPADGQIINIYLKRKSNIVPKTIDDLQYTQGVEDTVPIRLDDPLFDPAVHTTGPTIRTAVMPTFVGDGSTSIVDFVNPITDVPYVQTQEDDLLIFRPIESDGAVIIEDENILDTIIIGGSLNQIDGQFANANGISAEDISLDGGKYISPDQVPAPEENIPGQVSDVLSVKVYATTNTGSPTVKNNIIEADGLTRIFSIGQNVYSNDSVLVYLDKVKQVLDIDYTIDQRFNSIIFSTPPTSNSLVEIISLGLGGIAILDFVEFIGDGETSNFLTNANYNLTQSILVTVNGIDVDVAFVESSQSTNILGKTLVQFGEAPNFGSVIKIISFGAGFDTDSSQLSLVRINQQTFVYDNSTRSFELDRFVSLNRGSVLSSMIVNVNNRALQGPDTIYADYDGTNRIFELGVNPFEPAGTILTGNIKVYINGELKEFINDYSYNGSTKILTIAESVLNIGDKIKIENDLRAEYFIDNNRLIINPLTSLETDSTIEVIWFSEYPSLEILSDEFTGGQVNYDLQRIPLGIDYLWVYKNGERLVKDRDYYVSLPRGVVYLNIESSQDDKIKIIGFTNDIRKNPSAYEIHKDSLNRYTFKRFSISSELKKDLFYYDKTIEVNDASSLPDPVPNKNIPGAIYLNAERIEYFRKEGNILSQLRRGTKGTSIKEIHDAGSSVIDSSISENIPYSENLDKLDFISDGSSLLIGPLSYVPNKTNYSNWYRSSIPAEYGQCDDVEVFAAGVRLKKTWQTIYDSALGAYSPAADKQVEAEFSVNGQDNFIRLTAAVPAGTRITILRKTGKSWYDIGSNTATTGKTLLENTTAIAKFIGNKTTNLPE